MSALDAFAASLESRYDEGTSKRYLSCVRRYLAWLGGRQPDADSAARYLNIVAARRSKGAVGVMRAALGHYLRFLDPHLKVELPALPLAVALKEEEADSLLAACREHDQTLAALVAALRETEGATVYLQRLRGEVVLLARVRCPLSPELSQALAQRRLI